MKGGNARRSSPYESTGRMARSAPLKHRLTPHLTLNGDQRRADT